MLANVKMHFVSHCGRSYYSQAPRRKVRVEGRVLRPELEVLFELDAQMVYHYYLDVSRELNDQITSRYKYLIGLIRRTVELGRVDVLHEILNTSPYLAMPLKGQSEKEQGISVYSRSTKILGWDSNTAIPNLTQVRHTRRKHD